MGIFTARAAAEEFVRGDPFVLNGVVRKWIIRDWNEAIVPEGSAQLRLIGARQIGPLIQGVGHVPEHALEP